jgi:hypothetical protein
MTVSLFIMGGLFHVYTYDFQTSINITPILKISKKEAIYVTNESKALRHQMPENAQPVILFFYFINLLIFN